MKIQFFYFSPFFRFLGILMGIAIRSGSPLSLRLAEPMWKLLAGSSLTISDIAEVDKDYMPGLLCIRNMEADPKSFAAMDMSFSTPSAAGHEVQLSARYKFSLCFLNFPIFSIYSHFYRVILSGTLVSI